MNLKLKAFSQLVEDMGAALQSSASKLVDVSVGSVVRAIFEANASLVLWLQWLIVQVLQATRASTSSGPDLDSWMVDFGMLRLEALRSTGVVTFSRFAADLPAAVPLGALIKTFDGSLSFSVTENPTSSIWQAGSRAYILPSGVSSADVPVICTRGGSSGNVLAATILVIAASLPGIDQVVNGSPLSNGEDAEGDQAFRDRFQSYLDSRSRATLTAVQNAISSVRQGLNVAIAENTAPNGGPEIGSFLVVVDDGTGYPSPDLLSTLAAAVDAVRPIGTRFAIIRPQVLNVDVSMTVVLAAIATAAVSVPSIQNYVAIYLNSLPIGRSASITRIAQNAYLPGVGVGNIANIQMNGSPLDVVPLPFTVIKSGVIQVTVDGG